MRGGYFGVGCRAVHGDSPGIVAGGTARYGRSMIRMMLTLMLSCSSAFAGEASMREDPGGGETAIQAFGQAHRQCVEWTNGCIACTQAGCSTPGIACTPHDIVCTRL